METQHISKVIPGVLTAMQERSTPEKLLNTKEWAERFQFQTLNDPQLEAMVKEAAKFCMEMAVNAKPRWLSLVGTSGTGKTHLADRVMGQAPHWLHEHRSLLSGICRWEWSRLLSKLRDGEYWRIQDIDDANFAMLDDIGTEASTPFSVEKLFDVLSRRCNKWTVITANLSMSQIADTMDTRIASRMIRDGSVVVETNAIDFNLRRGNAQPSFRDEAKV